MLVCWQYTWTVLLNNEISYHLKALAWKPPLLDELTIFGLKGIFSNHPQPLLWQVKTVGQGCDFHGSSAEILGTPSCVFVMPHILLTKGLFQAHSELYSLPAGLVRQESLVVRLILIPGLSCLGGIPFKLLFFWITGLWSASLKLCVCNAASPWSQSPSPDSQCAGHKSYGNKNPGHPYLLSFESKKTLGYYA